MGRKKEQLQIV